MESYSQPGRLELIKEDEVSSCTSGKSFHENLPVIRTQTNSHALIWSSQIDLKLSKFIHMWTQTARLLKVSFTKQKQKPRVLNYRKHKFYNNKFFGEQFLSKLNNNLSKQDNILEKNKAKNWIFKKQILMGLCISRYFSLYFN